MIMRLRVWSRGTSKSFIQSILFLFRLEPVYEDDEHSMSSRNNTPKVKSNATRLKVVCASGGGPNAKIFCEMHK